MEPQEDDVSSSLASVFVQFKSPDKQRKALKGLFAELSLRQIRESFDVLDPINFKYDIIGNSPIEINAIIFQHLQIYQLFQAQRVSRTWKWILSSPEILDPPLEDWDSMGETPLRLPKGLTPQAIRSLKAEHVDAYRTGLPFSMMARTLVPEPNSKRVRVAYSDGIIAWIDQTERMVSVLLLESGAEYSYVSPNRELMTCITLSSSMVAVLTLSGICYVWEIPTGHAHFFRLPNILWDYSNVFGTFFVSSGSTLAILHSSRVTEEYLTTWNLETRKSYHFPAIVHQGEDLPDDFPQMHTSEKRVLISDSGQSIVLFEHIYDQPTDETRFTRLTLDGRFQASGFMECPSISCSRERFEHGRPLSCIKTSIVWTYRQFHPDEPLDNPAQRLEGNAYDDILDLLHIVYDPKQDRLRLKRDFARIHDALSIHSSLPWTTDHFFWKDVLYFHQHSAESGLQTIDLRNDKRSVARMDWYTPSNFQRGNRYDQKRDDERDVSDDLELYGMNCYPCIFGDGTYLIRAFESGFVACCFDKNITMVNEDQGYRTFRKSAKRKDRIVVAET